MIPLILLLLAIVSFGWAALIDAGHIDIGTAFQVLCIGLIFFAASFLPWASWRGER